MFDVNKLPSLDHEPGIAGSDVSDNTTSIGAIIIDALIGIIF